jgi:DNA modification methylase
LKEAYPIKSISTPISHSLIAETHPSLVLSHKYWARKPLNVVKEYVKYFTDEGDLVCDPFTGSGITNIASLELKRKTIGIDLNPIAIFITRMTSCHIDLAKYVKEFKNLENTTKLKINELYSVDCSICKKPAIMTHSIIERIYKITSKGEQELKGLSEDESTYPVLNALKNKEWNKYSKINILTEIKSNTLTKLLNALINDELVIFEEQFVEYKVRCEKCRDNKFHLFNEKIEKKLKENFDKIAYKWYPKDKVYHNSRICAYEHMKIVELFTKRNLKALSILLDEIEKIKDSEIRDMFRFTFSSALPQASKLVFVIEQRGRTTGNITKTKEVGSWTLPSFTVMPKHFEINVWNCFKERFEKVKRSKEEANYEIPVFEELPKKEREEYMHKTKNLPTDNPVKIKYFNKLFHHYNLAIIWSTLDLGFIPNSTVDYIFTDPPYGDSIPYLELSVFFNSWLKYNGKYPEFAPNFDDEIIISDSDERENKGSADYKGLLLLAFKETYRILKPNGWMSLTFHNRDIETWNSLIVSAQEAGFEYVSDVYQVPPRASAKSGLAKSGSMIGDMIVNFRKVQEKGSIRTTTEEDVEKLITKEAISILEERYGKATDNQLMRGVIHLLLKNNLTKEIKNPENYIQKIFSKHFDKTKGYWNLRSESDTTKVIQLEEKIEQIIKAVVSKRGGASFDEILAKIFTNLKNGHTPEDMEILKVLSRIAEVKKDRWILKGQRRLLSEEIISPDQVKKEEAEKKEITQHTKCIEIIAKIAELLNLKKSIGHTELTRIEVLRPYHDTLNGTGIPINDLQTIREIDIVLSKDKIIQSCFEIEFSTLKTVKFLDRYRTLRAVTLNTKIPLFVVIHLDDEKVIKKILLRSGNLDMDVNYIIDAELFTLYDKAVNKEIVLTLDHFKKISKKVEKQKLLDE